MDSNKETGSYYTPHEVVNFMIEYLKKNKQDFKNVLEPSAGDGRFLSALLPECNKLKAIELFDYKVEDIQSNFVSPNLKVEKADFMDYVLNTKEKYSLIIGNPPYINLKNMNGIVIDKAKKICESEGLNTSVMQNLWLAFVVGAYKLLDANGTIFFVLPMEFLQVQYAEKLRSYLESKFNTIHIIEFQKAIFPDIEQDVCLVYLTNKKNTSSYILYENYKNTMSQMPDVRNVIKKNKPLKKWTNAILSDEEIALIKGSSLNYSKIKNIGISAPGIVTGANKCFIINEDKVNELKCRDFVFPILQKSSYVTQNTIFIDDSVLNSILKRKKPMFLLNLAKIEESNLPRELKKYLDEEGQRIVSGKALKKCYKCANREPWYGVPIVNKGDIIFFKRYHKIPRVYVNVAEIHTTDAGYHIRLDSRWDKMSVIFCFFNSMTLAQCEFEGRYYGGGVSELVPSEFKELQIPYRKINKCDIDKLDNMFKANTELDEIVDFVNSKTIALDMNKEDVRKIEAIRKKLISRRCDKN